MVWKLKNIFTFYKIVTIHLEKHIFSIKEAPVHCHSSESSIINGRLKEAVWFQEIISVWSHKDLLTD